MLSRWPIRKKVLFGTSLLLVIVALLSITGFHGVYSYRALWRSLRGRAEELPFAAALGRHVSDLRATIREMRGHYDMLDANSAPALTVTEASQPDRPSTSDGHSNSGRPDNGEAQITAELDESEAALQRIRSQLRETMLRYRTQIAENDEGESPIDDSQGEQRAVVEIEQLIAAVDSIFSSPGWHHRPQAVAAVSDQLDRAQVLVSELPGLLHQRIHDLAGQVRTQYRTMIGFAAVTTVSAAVLLTLFIKLFYGWILLPLETLILGSRRVASGEFNHRIYLPNHDEMAELADAFNAMTGKFQSIRDDLDRQVQERTKQVVRSEQLASVGFLAAGVAHEINNPLASIAMCAESLEERIADLIAAGAQQPAAHDEGAADHSLAPRAPETSANVAADSDGDENWAVVRQYLQMIQDEAFRCKGITERLLDFSRVGDLKRHDTELGELVRNMISTVRHLGKYQNLAIEFTQSEPVVAAVNAQEIKQVVLNLITNALDSLGPDGRVRVEVRRDGDQAELLVADNGCGMTADVLEHLFEPFFTRRRTGQGIGLGLSITYRIVADHGGRIDAQSDGPGKGATFRVMIPLASGLKEVGYRSQAA